MLVKVKLTTCLVTVVGVMSLVSVTTLQSDPITGFYKSYIKIKPFVYILDRHHVQVFKMEPVLGTVNLEIILGYYTVLS